MGEKDVWGRIVGGVLRVYLQPIVCNKSLDVEMYEALARLEGKKGEINLPSAFLGIAKERGNYDLITRYMVRQSCVIARSEGISVSVNIDYSDIENDKILEFIYAEVRGLKGCGCGVNFEITEKEDIQDWGKANEFICEVKKYGSKVGIDDFGTGYSNISEVMNLDVDYIKIDGSLIKELVESDKNRALVRHIVSFAGELGIKTVAEHVSDGKIYKEVYRLGVDYSQGFYFGVPALYREGMADRGDEGKGREG